MRIIGFVFRNFAKVTGVDLQIALIQAGKFHERPKEADFEWLVSVDRNHEALTPSGHREDVMAAVDAGEHPTAALDETGEFASGDLFHTVTSIIWSGADTAGASSAMSQPSIASRMFARSSSSVSPWETQPGRAGTSPQKPPSSAGWMMALRITHGIIRGEGMRFNWLCAGRGGAGGFAIDCEGVGLKWEGP